MYSHVELPRLRVLARHALPHVIEGSVVPVAVFYGALRILGVRGALVAALAWCYLAIAFRLASGRRVPALLVLGALGLTARTLIAAATGSVFVYFLQPTLATVAVAGAFLLSVPAGRPLAQRLAADFLPLPDAFLDRPRVRRMFVRITLLWAVVMLLNAAVSLWMLLTLPVSEFVLARTAVSLVVTGSGIAVSTIWFRRHVLRPEAATVRT